MLIMNIALGLLLVLSQTVSARMYQWTEADTGSTQLSGKPPMWYRSDSVGPRIFVFDNGRLIDDTDVKVDEEVRIQLRQKAFALVEEDQTKAKDKLAKSLELKEKYEEEKAERSKPDSSEEENQEVAAEEERYFDVEPIDDQSEEVDAEDTVENLRKLITEWENAQTENAKKALEQ